MTVTAMDSNVVAERAPMIGSRLRTRPLASPKRLFMAAGLAALVASSCYYGHSWWTEGRFLQSTDDAYVGGDVTTIAPKVGGFITAVAVGDNQVVHVGELLLRLDDRDFKAQLARADASVAAQIATLANLDATRRLQQSMIEQAEAEASFAEAESARTRFDVDRYRTLSDSKYASEQRFQQADADDKKAQASARRAHAGVEAERRKLDVIDTQKSQTSAALAQATADRDLARLNLSYTEMRAPIDGVVGNRSARVGAYATIGAGLISLVPADGLWVDGNFKESQLASMHPGQSVRVFADVLPGERIAGHVVSLAPATGAQFSVLPAENATGNFTKIVQRVPVRIALEGGASALGRLRPGLSVTAEVDVRDNGSVAIAQAMR